MAQVQIPGSTPYMVEFVVGSLLYSGGFSSGTPVFPSPQKPTFPNSNSIRNRVDEEPLCGCATSKSLFINLFMYLHSGLSTVPKLIIQETPDFGPYIYIHTLINIVRGCQK